MQFNIKTKISSITIRSILKILTKFRFFFFPRTEPVSESGYGSLLGPQLYLNDDNN